MKNRSPAKVSAQFRVFPGFKRIFGDRDSKVTTKFIPRKIHQGFKDVVHGGIIVTLLDEVMAHLCIAKGFYGVTARIEVRFTKPALVGEILKIEADLLEFQGRTLKAKAKIVNPQGEIIAFGNSTFVKLHDLTVAMASS